MGLYCDIIRSTDEDIKKAAELNDKTEELYNFIQNTDAENWFELDKAWHGIHFLLTESLNEHAAGFLLNDGNILRDYNWSEIYGVNVINMRSFNSAEAAQFNRLCKTIGSKDLGKYYDPAKMFENNIYPGIWEKKEFFTSRFIAKHFKVSPQLDYLKLNFEKLRVFLDDTEKKKMGIIIKYHQ